MAPRLDDVNRSEKMNTALPVWAWSLIGIFVSVVVVGSFILIVFFVVRCIKQLSTPPEDPAANILRKPPARPAFNAKLTTTIQSPSVPEYIKSARASPTRTIWRILSAGSGACEATNDRRNAPRYRKPCLALRRLQLQLQITNFCECQPDYILFRHRKSARKGL